MNISLSYSFKYKHWLYTKYITIYKKDLTILRVLSILCWFYNFEPMKPSDTISYKLHAIVFIMDAMARAYIKNNSEITFEQFLVMLCAYENPWHTQKFLADWLQLTEATTSYMANKMESIWLIEFKQDKLDKRSKKLYLSKKWKWIIDEIYPALEWLMSKKLTEIWGEKIAQFNEWVNLIFDALIKECDCKTKLKHI